MPNRIFKNVPVEIPNKSGFFEGHYNHFSSNTGTLTPVLTDLLIPNDKINLSLSCQVSLPPMSSDFFGHLDMKFEAFFIPLRLCYGGWQDFITHELNQGYPDGTASALKVGPWPYVNLCPATGPNASVQNVNEYGPGTLADYLGCKTLVSSVGNVCRINNPTSMIAYHLVWQEWYRNPFIQKPAFTRPFNASADFSLYAQYLPYTFRTYTESPWTDTSLDTSLNNGYLWQLRQRNWDRDYFTNAKPAPQAGMESRLAFTTDDDGNGSFTIASLRAANSLQQWLERNNLAGFRYADQINAHFGIRPSDAVIDRPIFIGQQVVPVYTKGITQTAQPTADSTSRQPFNSVGTKVGQTTGVGSGYLGSFHATEYGYLMVIASLVPKQIYSSGTRRYLDYYQKSHFATPLLQGVGDQAIAKQELLNLTPADKTASEVFGYTQRYSEYKFMSDEVHGILQDGQNLDMFTLQSSFTDDVELSSDFITIPTNYLDQVTAVASDSSNYGYWCDVWFDYNKSSVLSAYSIPTLGDLKNTHTEVIPNGGVML